MDTLAIARTLGKAGMDQELAETVVDTLKAVVKPLATTNDVERIGERMKGVEGRMKGVETSMGAFKVEMKELLGKNEAGMKEFKEEMSRSLENTRAGMKDDIKSQINSMKWFFGIAIGLLGLVGLLIKLFA